VDKILTHLPPDMPLVTQSKREADQLMRKQAYAGRFRP
jgi:hypothetical protein